MPYKKSISGTERRQRDYLRRRGLQVAAVYQGRLQRDRRKELRRVLELALDFTPDALPDVLQEYLDESAYLPEWWTGLWTQAGLPMAKTTAQQLRAVKAAGEEDVWLLTLRTYAATRAGNEILIVSGTWKDSLVKLVRNTLQDDLGLGIEKLTKLVYQNYVGDLEKWQCRRIAQTEAMIGMADASALAAQTLDIPFTKQWCISGLGNTRESHEAMDGVIVDADEPFALPGGLLMYPHDTSLGADASEIINCACDCIRRPKASQQEVREPDTAPAPVADTVVPGAPKKVTAKEKRVQEIIAEMDPALPDATRRAIAENDLKLEKALGITKGKPMDIDGADIQKANPHWATDGEYRVNCATCAPTYVLRERGFDITAKGKVAGSGSLNDQAAHHKSFAMWKNADGTSAKPTIVAKWMTDKNYKKMTAIRWSEFYEETCKETGTYITTVRWGSGGGHATIIKRLADGKLIRIEPQRYSATEGKKRSVQKLYGQLECAKSSLKKVGVLRVDDKLFDPKWAGLFETK